MTILDAFKIVQDRSLVDCKKAVKSGSIIYVSPVMYELPLKERGKDLAHLITNIRLVDIGVFNPFGVMDEMTTKPEVNNDVPLWTERQSRHRMP